MADTAAAFPEFTLGDRMKKAREWVGIKSADRMAELLGAEVGQKIAGSTVSAWERGANQPTRPLRMEDVVTAYAKICTTVGKETGKTITRAWLYGVESRATRSEKSERASHLRGLARNPAPKPPKRALVPLVASVQPLSV